MASGRWESRVLDIRKTLKYVMFGVKKPVRVKRRQTVTLTRATGSSSAQLESPETVLRLISNPQQGL
jgi:hypothetical protein